MRVALTRYDKSGVENRFICSTVNSGADLIRGIATKRRSISKEMRVRAVACHEGLVSTEGFIATLRGPATLSRRLAKRFDAARPMGRKLVGSTANGQRLGGQVPSSRGALEAE